jgi:hypothetical protein
VTQPPLRGGLGFRVGRSKAAAEKPTSKLTLAVSNDNSRTSLLDAHAAKVLILNRVDLNSTEICFYTDERFECLTRRV